MSVDYFFFKNVWLGKKFSYFDPANQCFSQNYMFAQIIKCLCDAKSKLWVFTSLMQKMFGRAEIFSYTDPANELLSQNYICIQNFRCLCVATAKLWVFKQFLPNPFGWTAKFSYFDPANQFFSLFYICIPIFSVILTWFLIYSSTPFVQTTVGVILCYCNAKNYVILDFPKQMLL